jgi:hypothetical protein
MNEIKDCRGIVINVGDTIVYPGRRGSSLWLSSGIVQPPKFGALQQSLTVKKDNGRLVEVFETWRVAVVCPSVATSVDSVHTGFSPLG